MQKSTQYSTFKCIRPDKCFTLYHFNISATKQFAVNVDVATGGHQDEAPKSCALRTCTSYSHCNLF